MVEKKPRHSTKKVKSCIIAGSYRNQICDGKAYKVVEEYGDGYTTVYTIQTEDGYTTKVLDVQIVAFFPSYDAAQRAARSCNKLWEEWWKKGTSVFLKQRHVVDKEKIKQEC